MFVYVTGEKGENEWECIDGKSKKNVQICLCRQDAVLLLHVHGQQQLDLFSFPCPLLKCVKWLPDSSLQKQLPLFSESRFFFQPEGSE